MKEEDLFFGVDPDRVDKKIFEEDHLGNMTVKNRLIRSATLESLADEEGKLSDEIMEVYRELARGGVGTIITGFTAVNGEDPALPLSMKLDRDEMIDEYRKLTDEVHSFNCRIISQLAANQYVKDGKQLDIDELDSEDIQQIIDDFAEAARRADEAGFDGIELHAAHGYLLSRFCSPYYNHRSDDFGGASYKRSRILAEILDAIKEKAPGLTLLAKINFYDGVEGGVTISDALTTVMTLEEHGLDGLDISGAHPSRTDFDVPSEEGYFKDYSLSVKSISDMPVILTGGNRSIESMETILNDENADFIALARPLIREPQLPNLWKEDRNYRAQCVSCNGCYKTPGHRCVFNK